MFFLASYNIFKKLKRNGKKFKFNSFMTEAVII